jgi:hypothetical protein
MIMGEGDEGEVAEILKYHIFMKIRPVGAEMFHADRQT